jgi:PPOX class probable FMN-dependent enzyme
MPDDIVTQLVELREIYPEPKGRAVEKQLSKLDKHCRVFIGLSPFLVMATDGDASPKGDAPGFVRVIDDNTLLIPDRRGNNRLDSMQNLLRNPRIGLLFLVPGIGETLRINGTASITTDPALLAPTAVDGKVPVAGIIVNVEEAFLHCAKALIRSHLWQPDTWPDRDVLPSGGRMMAEQIGTDPETEERDYEHRLKETLY